MAFARMNPAIWQTAVVAALLGACSALGAVQASPASTSPAKSTTAKSTTTHTARKHKARKAAAKPAEVAVAPVVVPAPPPPDWPVNDKPAPASVNWNGHDLSIAASNASLQQILSQVSTATGVKVEGAETDQRIYGNYGPASARDVLSQLLDGSGYNVLLIGDKGEGTPRELVLTARGHASASSPRGNSQANQNSDDEAPEEPEQQEPTNVIQHRPFTMQPGQGRSPEQLQQEEQQRIEQLREQQQQQQQQQQQLQQPSVYPPKN